ncbi:hypothetical protein RHMOL_Rhmol03G0111600 [Rhododendron molle]|uniref:Uncharacterized protein n=1 Tax=Rhododendron molle TaxID=49168 RepID=A0ACC0PFA1_RHOML|nr:hypothetical protein RHMOL_Rhmol03G0111600 [Rhododendron molle]
MAAFDHVRNIHDIALKPRLLRSLVREHLPDEKHPFKGPLELSHVVSTVKTHRLLSESLAGVESTDPKAVESWKAAVDAWVDRVFSLASSNMQPPADSHFVKVASCASLSDLFTRMGRFPRIKKDATSQAVKLTQPVLKLLNEDSSEAVWEVAVCLLCTFTTSFPSSIQRCYDTVEAAVVSKIMSGKCSVKLMKELGHCLALLPKSKGDEESWSLMMQKILLRINVHLNDAFQGVEEDSKGNEAMRILVPPGKDPPPPLGGQVVGEASDERIKRSQQLQISTTLMRCSCTMLTSTYPVQVRVPIRSLVVLAARVLMVDGSLSQAIFPFMTAMQQESICLELPVLHMHSLELLSAIIKSARSQLLPHAAEIVRLLTEYFKRCVLPDLRIKVYSIIRILLMSLGVGMAVYLTQEVIKNAFLDLQTIAYEGGQTSSSAYSKASSEILLQPGQKKRKHSSTTVSLDEQTDRVDLEVGVPLNPIPISLKIAALETLEALLTVGSALGAESWRPSIDILLISVATNACKGGWTKEENHSFLSSESVPAWADFQLAALRALLASLLSPTRFRSPNLARGLELFRRGRQETGTKTAEFCAHALLALEVLIHPRALSLIDFSSPSNTSFNGVNSRFPDVYSYGNKQNTPFSSGIMGKGPNDSNSIDDDLHESWLANDDEIEIPETETGKDRDYAEKHSEMFGVSEENRQELVSVHDARINEAKGDENMVEVEHLQEPIKLDGTVPIVGGGSLAAQISSRVVSDSSELDPVEGKVDTGNNVLAALTDSFDMEGVSTNAATSSLGKNKDSAIDLDSESESIPDIVDGDPDSD